MKLWRCCCGWSYVIGKRRVYGAIYPMGIGTYPQALADTQAMMSRAYWEQAFSDCAACHAGRHQHHTALKPSVLECRRQP